MEFEHIGLIADEKKEGEDWVEATRVWVTNPKEHPFLESMYQTNRIYLDLRIARTHQEYGKSSNKSGVQQAIEVLQEKPFGLQTDQRFLFSTSGNSNPWQDSHGAE